MKICILAFGNTIKNPNNLSIKGTFTQDGPILPLELSRISSSKNLTLVVDAENGTRNKTFFAEATSTDLNVVIKEFGEKEKIKKLAVGFIDIKGEKVNERAAEIYPEVVRDIINWANDKGFEGVVWSNLRANYEKETGYSFNVINAQNYIRFLSEDKRANAREYIKNLPATINTPLRKVLVAEAA